MRGAFVACLGPSDALPTRLDSVASQHLAHQGKSISYNCGHLHLALLTDSEQGPNVVFRQGTTLLVHGTDVGPLDELVKHGVRFAVLEFDGVTLKVARDPMGLCPLFYRVVDDALWLSTEVNPLVKLADVRPDLQALTAQAALVPHEERTGWLGIHRILPGTTMTVTTDLHMKFERYWNPAGLVGTFHGDRRTAEQELRSRLTSAVRRCMTLNTGILLSGGLDSAAVATTAATLGEVAQLVHVRFPGITETDEVAFAQEVAGKTTANLDIAQAQVKPWHPREDLDILGIPYLAGPQIVWQTALERIAQFPVRTVLDGNDGDGIMGYPGREWGELLRTGSWRRLAELSRIHGVQAVLRGLADDLVPPPLRLRRLRGRPAIRSYSQRIERYFAPPVRVRMRQRDDERWRQPFRAWRSRQLRQVLPITTTLMEQHELRAARLGLDIRHPFADRELVEFLISLPVSLKSDPAHAKHLLVMALADLLPQRVAARIHKPLYLEVLNKRVDAGVCMEVIRSSGISLPQVRYETIFQDASNTEGVPPFLLMTLARAHAFVSGK